MRRALPLIALLAGLLAVPSGAVAQGGGAGHNKPTRKLERSFSIALFERVGSTDGCYPAPGALAAEIRAQAGFKTGLAKSYKKARKRGVVFVITRGASCDRLRMALNDKVGLYVLDSALGHVRLKGKKRKLDPVVPWRGPLPRLRRVARDFTLSTPDDPERLAVICPKNTHPLGGGMATTPPLSGDGEGAYPHSYERLGAQRGWHITPVLIDPTPASTTPRTVRMQAVCGSWPTSLSSPHSTVFVKPGEFKTVVATCPKGQVLFSGGFQRTDFLSHSGDYPTESRMISPRSWQVSGAAFGVFGGELTAIGYCVRSKRPLLTEVLASVAVPSGGVGTVTTPRCPRGRGMTNGGFTFNGATTGWFAGGSLTAKGSWSAAGFGKFGAATMTAYGYCLPVR